jgi:carbon-monoxide dehydrogenase medium subunit
MIPGSFDYHRPNSIDAAVSLLASLGEDARVIAGGHSLIPMMKARLAVPEHLIDLQDIAELRGIAVAGGTVTIGAMTTQAELMASATLTAACPLIREVSAQIADPQVRNVGTLGGNVANGDPGNDMPAVMQALNATYLLRGPRGTREVQARDFYQAAYQTALKDGEILTAVRFVAPRAGHGYAYMKQKRKVGDYATAAAAVVLTMNGRICGAADIALTNVADTPLYVAEAAAAIVGKALDSAVLDAAVAAAKARTSPAADGRGPADFRTHVAGVMVRRAIQKAAERAR